MTISFKTKTGMTNIRHNNRDLSEEEFKSNEHRHINRALSHENITIIKRDIREVYHDEFDDALNTYNSKQRRKDRKIEDYYKHVKKSKTLDLQREFVVSVGNKSDWEKMDFNKKREVGEALASYVRDFNERHDHLVIYNAVVHLDEDGLLMLISMLFLLLMDIKMVFQNNHLFQKLSSRKDLKKKAVAN